MSRGTPGGERGCRGRLLHKREWKTKVKPIGHQVVCVCCFVCCGSSLLALVGWLSLHVWWLLHVGTYCWYCSFCSLCMLPACWLGRRLGETQPLTAQAGDTTFSRSGLPSLCLGLLRSLSNLNPYGELVLWSGPEKRGKGRGARGGAEARARRRKERGGGGRRIPRSARQRKHAQSLCEPKRTTITTCPSLCQPTKTIVCRLSVSCPSLACQKCARVCQVPSIFP